jgi:hypothetical protein
MVKLDDVKPGAVVRSLDGGALLKIRRVDETHAHGASPDGANERKVKLSALTAHNVRGWVLERSAEETA